MSLSIYKPLTSIQILQLHRQRVPCLLQLADCSKLASVEISSLGPQTTASSKKYYSIILFQTSLCKHFVSCLPISSGKFAAISCSLGPGYTEGIITSLPSDGPKGQIDVRSRHDILANEII